MPKIEVRDYQERAARSAHRKHRKGVPVCVVSPQGSGKTVMITRLVQLARRAKKRVLIVCYRREAVFQTMEHLSKMGLNSDNSGVILAGFSYHKKRPIQVAAWSTLIRRVLPPADLVILDECHHALCLSYESFVEHYGREKIVGFSATPYRRDNKGLGDVFDELLVAAQPSELISRRFLANPRVFTAGPEFDLDIRHIKKAAHGDFAPGDLQRVMDRDDLIGNIVSHWRREARDQRTLVFAVGVDHSEHIAERFRRKGVKAAHIDGSMPIEKREGLIEGFRAGRIQVLSNCMILSESFDLPACQAVVLARPTTSFALAMQQPGRVMRPSGRRRPVVLDHALNCIRFGLPQSDRDHQLTDTHTVVPSASPIKVCPQCRAVCRAGRSKCSACGHLFKKTERNYHPGETRDLLREINPLVIQRIRSNVEQYGKKIGAEEGWAQRVMRTLSLDV